MSLNQGAPRRLLLAGCALIALLGSSVVPPRPRLIWNATASAPIGFYWLTPSTPTQGALVLANLPEPARTLAADRNYLPRGVRIIKHVAAMSGDQICADNETIIVNNHTVATRLEHDFMDRPLPIWTGCRMLGAEVLLLNPDVSASFDGRYCGPIPMSNVVGTLTPLWTRPQNASPTK